MKKAIKCTLKVSAIIAGTLLLTSKKCKTYQKMKNQSKYARISRRYPTDYKAHFIGGGLASMAGATYLIRDLNLPGKNIHIYEGLNILGGSNDGGKGTSKGFLCRGGRMLNEETYENFWELFSSIPSLDNPKRSVTEEILNFDHAHPTCAKARLINKDGTIVDTQKMGFHNKDRWALLKLMMTPENKLDDLTIEDWFSDTPHFFETNFWYMWQTTFAFQKWSSLFELRRYMNRMIFEFSRIETLEGVTRTPLNQYESVILPIREYLKGKGVNFHLNTVVTDMDFEKDSTTVTRLYIDENGTSNIIPLNKKDKCFMTNGCMTDDTTIGDYHTPAPEPSYNSISADLWRKVASKKNNLGNPKPFFHYPSETLWQSFTVTLRGNKLLKMIENYSGNIPGSGALMTFKDSNWLMSIVVAAQPHFMAQDLNTTIFWGYGLFPNKKGDYIKKTMKECTGEEIFMELMHHLHFDDKMEELKETVVDVIPCILPYIDAQFQPHKMSDRPKVVPKGSTNFAMISQFVEIPKDMVFTEEYSVRAARIAVYTLTKCYKPIKPVTDYNKRPDVLIKALIKSLT